MLLYVVVVFVGFVVGVVVNALVAVVAPFLLLLDASCNFWVFGCWLLFVGCCCHWIAV